MGGAFGPGHQGGGHHAVEDGGGSPGSAAACRQRCWLLAARFLVGSAADLAALAERAAVWASAPGHLPPAPITSSRGRATPGALPRWPTLVAGSGEHHRDPRPGEALDRERLGISASRRRIRYGSSGPVTSKPLRTVSPDRGRRGMPTTTLVAGRSLRIGAGGVLALECSPALGESIESRDQVGHLHASGSAGRPQGGALGTDRPGRQPASR